jgi:hypothetical protein
MVQPNDLQPGDILICKGKSWITKGILFVTKGKWSHTALYAEVWNQPGVIEAQRNGVNFKLWDVWREKWGYEYIVFRPIFQFDEKEIMLKAFSKCGETKYDFWKFLIRIPKKLFFNKWKDKGHREDNKLICSAFTGWVWDLPNWQSMTPHEQFIYLSNNKLYNIINK